LLAKSYRDPDLVVGPVTQNGFSPVQIAKLVNLNRLSGLSLNSTAIDAEKCMRIVGRNPSAKHRAARNRHHRAIVEN
jgi:hypothetical protein